MNFFLLLMHILFDKSINGWERKYPLLLFIPSLVLNFSIWYFFIENFERSVTHSSLNPKVSSDFIPFSINCFLFSDLKYLENSFKSLFQLFISKIYKISVKYNLGICENKISWDRVYISKKDFIFPPKACEWFECEKIYLNAPHFVFFKFSDFGEFFEI